MKSVLDQIVYEQKPDGNGNVRHRASLSRVQDIYLTKDYEVEVPHAADNAKATARAQIAKFFYGDLRDDVRELEHLIAMRCSGIDDPAFILIKRIRDRLW